MKNIFKNRKVDTKLKGFTLIELIVVIAIIGILATIIYPSFSGYLAKGRNSRAFSNARAIKQKIDLIYNDTTSYPVSLTDANTYVNFAGSPGSIPASLTATTSISAAGQIAFATTSISGGTSYLLIVSLEKENGTSTSILKNGVSATTSPIASTPSISGCTTNTAYDCVVLNQ